MAKYDRDMDAIEEQLKRDGRVVIEFDANNGNGPERERKTFTKLHEARGFYAKLGDAKPFIVGR